MAVCPICGSPRDPKDRFCRTCGAVFTAEPSHMAPGVTEPGDIGGPLPEPAAQPTTGTTAVAEDKPKRGRRAKKKDRSSDHGPVEDTASQRRGGAWIALIVLIPIILCSCALFVLQLLLKMIS